MALRHRLACRLLLGAVCLASAACSVVPPEYVKSRQDIGNLSMGLSLQEIVARLGPPERRESYRLSPDEGVSFLFYRTGPSELTESGEDAGLTPVAVGTWGLRSTASSFYNSIRRKYPLIAPEQEGARRDSLPARALAICESPVRQLSGRVVGRAGPISDS